MPNELDDVIVCSDGIWPNCRSSGAVDQRSDSIGIGAGQLRCDLNGWEIDLRQGGNRQPPIAEDPPSITATPSSEVAIGR